MSAAPMAKAAINLSDEDRLRIVQELGLDESQLDAIPSTIHLARYAIEEEDDAEVEGFAFNAFATPVSFKATPTTPQIQGFQVGGFGGGRLPGSILVPV